MKLRHNFAESLAISQAQANEPWWEDVYRAAFSNFAGMVNVRDDGWAQRGGIDRVITLKSGKTVSVDEKSRKEDWPDILWEFWSVREKKIPGWCNKDQACDFIAYAFIPSKTCYLLPALQMRRAWAKYGRTWIDLGRARENGFRLVEAQNDGYVTESVAVPLRESFDAITDAMVVGW
jgi:hypothetical protein